MIYGITQKEFIEVMKTITNKEPKENTARTAMTIQIQEPTNTNKGTKAQRYFKSGSTQITGKKQLREDATKKIITSLYNNGLINEYKIKHHKDTEYTTIQIN